MNKKIFIIVLVVIALTVAIASLIAVAIFDTSFARDTIDYFSFVAALFLIIEGLYKIKRCKDEPYFPNQLLRHLRIIIGTCVFTIHVMQYVYGV